MHRWNDPIRSKDHRRGTTETSQASQTHTHTLTRTNTHTHVLPPPKESQPLLLNKGKTQYTECQDTHTFNHHRRSTPRDHGKIGNDYHHHQRHTHSGVTHTNTHTQRHTLNRITVNPHYNKVMLHVMYPSVTRKEMF